MGVVASLSYKEKKYFVADVLVFWLLQSLHSLFHNVPGALSVGLYFTSIYWSRIPMNCEFSTSLISC